LVPFLPFRWHDLIYFPLPGLSSILIRLGRHDPKLGEKVIAEAAETIGQKEPARRALIELQALALENAALEQRFASAAELELRFLPAQESLATESPFHIFAAAARDLEAARLSTSHLHKRRSLERADQTLSRLQLSAASAPRSDRLSHRLLPTARIWRDAIANQLAALSRQEQEQPQVPPAFVVGRMLGPEDEGLFKGRADMVSLIDQDLVSDRRSPILLLGQRRVGKSSLLSMLPARLGTGTTVVSINFQGLSGSDHLEQPHRIVAEAVHAASPEQPRPPAGRWGKTLDWLAKIDVSLAADDQRMLIAIDEVERLEEELRAGRTVPDLLDMARAAGDRLGRIRIMLVSAWSLDRLGRHWSDRLISAVTRRLGYLDRESARALVTSPIPDFPDIYPEGGVERILAATACQPYLIQLVCDALCRQLNSHGRLRASDDDLDRAIDDAIVSTPLFQELWNERSDDEQQILQAVATGRPVPDDPSPPLRRLLREEYVTADNGSYQVKVPLFATWIRSYT
jgi:hypothetical protein